MGSKARISSPGSQSARTAAAMASVAPAVTSTSVAGSTVRPQKRAWWSAMASRSDSMPMPGGYWFCPERIASIAASDTSIGPSSSGNPWPRLMAPVAVARADISAKIVVPSPSRRGDRAGRRTIWSASHASLRRFAHVGTGH